jgi:hypothetical protein
MTQPTGEGKMDIAKRIEEVKGWQLRQGKNEFLRHLAGGGKPITTKEAIIAKCYECNCGYDDGPQDCKIPECPLYDFMPYKEGGPRKGKVTEQMRERGRQLSKNRREQSTAR